MSYEDLDKPNRQVEIIDLELGKGVKDITQHNKPTWMLCRELGRGAFGTVYHVVNEATKKEAALKAETKQAGDNLLKIEREIMIAMQHEPTAMKIYDDGLFNDYRFIVMTLCGPDLEKLADLMGYKFTQETILRVSIRTLLAIKTLHDYEYVHRDLKPCNFALSYLPTSPHIYLFDYGMARKYARHDAFGNWYLRRPREHVQFRGTIRYCSMNMHNRKELGRVDDIWSWLFMLLEMHTPLPWGQTTIPERCEMLKQEHFTEYLQKDPFLLYFQPVVNMLNAWDFADRPDYSKVYEHMLAKLRELNGKVAGPNEFDKKIAAYQAEQEKCSAYKTDVAREPNPPIKSEEEELKMLTTSFAKVIVPGGAKLVLAEGENFFGQLGPKRVPMEASRPEARREREEKVEKIPEKREERTDENKKKKEEKSDDGKKKKKTATSNPGKAKLLMLKMGGKTPLPGETSRTLSATKGLTGRKAKESSFAKGN